MKMLGMVDDEHLSPTRIGNRIGITRPSAERRIAHARRRQELVHGKRLVGPDPCWCEKEPEDEHEERCRLLLGLTAKLSVAAPFIQNG